MMEYILVAETTIITGILCGVICLGYHALQKLKGTVSPIIGLVNQFGK